MDDGAQIAGKKSQPAVPFAKQMVCQPACRIEESSSCSDTEEETGGFHRWDARQVKPATLRAPFQTPTPLLLEA